MDKEGYYRFHLVFYFIVSAIGGVFVHIGRKLPVYNEQTGEVIKTYSLPFIIFGISLIVISFIGCAFFNNVDDVIDN